MPQIDGILKIVVQQDATELRMGTDQVPKLLRLGLPKRFMMPGTSEETLRTLLGETFEEDTESRLYKEGRVRTTYAPEGLGSFGVEYRLRYADTEENEDAPDPSSREAVGFDVIFRREATRLSDDEEEDDLFSLPRRRPAPAPSPPLQPSPPSHSPSSGAQTLAAPSSVHPAAALRGLEQGVPQPGQELRALLRRAVAQRASDLHLSAGEQPVLRVDGQLVVLQDEPEVIPEVVLEGCLLPGVRRRLAVGASADLMVSEPGLGRFRMNIYQASQGMTAALRVLPDRPPRLDDLNLPVPLHGLVYLPGGLVIMTGPTGSGKSSTLAALAQEALHKRSVVVVTLEDPIEYTLRPRTRGSLVRQREVGRHVKDFATGLRDALREDPDILLVGEMRDPETISLAMTAAETGHLVLTSMHSRSAAYAVERIVDSYPPQRQHQVRAQLADALQAVVAQRLLPRSSGGGRVPVLEVMRVTHNIASMIRDNKTAQIPSAIQSGGSDGMLPLERSLAEAVRKGQVTAEVAEAMANDPKVFQTYLRR